MFMYTIDSIQQHNLNKIVILFVIILFWQWIRYKNIHVFNTSICNTINEDLALIFQNNL